jgi:hypothetical protein
MAGIQIDGMDKLRRALARAGDLAEEALSAAMVQEMESVITEAKQEAPVDTGTLRASGTVLPPKKSSQGVSVTAGFGGAAQAYAVIVHEKHSSKSKFLERPFLSRASKLPSNLAERVERAWQRLKV